VADIERDSDVQVRRTEPDAVTNLRIVLELCAAGQLRCSAKTQRPTAASVGGLAAVLASGDFYPYEPIAAYAWPLLVQAGGLAELAGSRLQLTARGRTALTAPAATTIRDLWRRWIRGAVIDELSRVEAIKGQRAANALSCQRPAGRSSPPPWPAARQASGSRWTSCSAGCAVTA
jgi:hypothetical protein